MAQKISEYLKELSSHDIYDHEALAKDFKEKTGYDSFWRTHTPNDTKTAIENRGLGGELSKEPAKLLAYGWEIAEDLAKELTGFSSNKEGRSRRFFESIEAIQNKGL